MKFSYAMLPDHPVDQLLGAIETADRLGFYGCYAADETFHKDSWLILAAAAGRTEQLRLCLDATHVILKEPTILAQQLATLDELSRGRAEAVFAIGNIAMLEQYGLAWKLTHPIARLREAHHVLRTFLDEGKIDFEGEFYRYSGLFTSARPVQERIPLKIGAMRGPRSFELAGEISEGMHHAVGYSSGALGYAAEHVRIGAERAGRDWRSLDLGAWMPAAIASDSAKAKEAARVVAAFYVSSLPPEQIDRHGLERAELASISEAFARGDIEQVLALTTPEIADRLALAGTADEWIERIEQEIVPTGFDHLALCIVDPYLVEQWAGVRVDDVPDLEGQLRLVAEHVVPAFV
jgi:5,10-methylenetetrahydromethanopterin reductase